MDSKLTYRKWPLWGFILAAGAFYGIVVVGSEFLGVPVSGAYSVALTVAQWGLAAFCACGLIALLAACRVVFAIAFPLLMALSGAIMYLHLAIGTRLTPLSVELALVNDASMWWSMMSAGLILSFLAGAGFGTLAAWLRWTRVSTSLKLNLISALCGSVIALLPLVIPRLEAPLGARLPYSMYFAPRGYMANRWEFTTERHTYDHELPGRDSRPAPDVIFIIGESLRSDHLPQNGYGRNTMPLVSRDTAAVTLPNVYTEATHTFASVPVIMTRADSLQPYSAYNDQSFITLFRKAGYRTAWIANQDLSRSYTYFAHEADTLIYCTTAASLIDYDKWLDTATLPPLSGLIGHSDVPQLVVIHTIGSHWWYKSHYTDRQARFLPDVDHKDVAGLTREQMVNAYDNTIIATDDFLARIFDTVRRRNCIVIYISDHGESLGEEGIYLHGTPTEALHRPACLVWYSPAYAATYPEKTAALKASRSLPWTTEAIFHSVLDASGISTPYLNPNLSFFHNETN